MSELQFVIMVDTEDIDNLTNVLLNNLEGASAITPYSFDWKDNWVQIRKNEDYDRSLMQDAEDGFLYYPTQIEVSPRDHSMELDQQVQFAKRIIASIRKINYHFELIADFDNLIG